MEPIPSLFSLTSTEDSVFLGIQKLCRELGIGPFFFLYGEEAGDATEWRATTDWMCEELADRLEEAVERMRETNEEESD